MHVSLCSLPLSVRLFGFLDILSMCASLLARKFHILGGISIIPWRHLVKVGNCTIFTLRKYECLERFLSFFVMITLGT